MNEFFNALSGKLIDLTVYGAVVVCFIVGLSKCIFPLNRAARAFRKGIHNLASFKPNETGRPDWQDTLYLGKPMQKQWSRFLINAEQLDQRGLSCNVEEYINDETTLRDFAHFQLAEVIPGLLTSFGILGTFIGLMRGLGNLDLSSAANTVSSIHTMISGMTFAYGTSIAGLVCSLLFNIFFRAAQGAATGAMDDFNHAFTEVVMQRPLDDWVRQTCYMEDQAVFLSSAFNEVNQHLENGISQSVSRAFAPISQSMQQFILSETHSQLEGLNHVVNQFVDRMNTTLNGQFLQLGQTLSKINQSQAISHESMNTTMAAADSILNSMQKTGEVTQAVIDRFDGYVSSLNKSQAAGTMLAEETAGLLSGIHKDIAKQSERYSALVDAQADLRNLMKQYAAWSGRVLEAVDRQAEAASDRTHEVANEMARSGKLLQESYSSFVENISTGLSRTLGLFEESMHDMSAKLARDLSGAARSDNDGEAGIKQMSRMQQALNDMTAALNRATAAAEKMAEKAS